MNIAELLEQQRTFFQTGTTLSSPFRKQALQKLYQAIQKHEEEIHCALKADLGKSDFEGFMCEVGLSLSEISYMIRNLKKFTKKHTVRTPMTHFDSHSFTKASPYGNVLVMSPWNYPFLLTMEPLCDAIAAGNTVIVKPSAYSPETSRVMAKLVSECFPPEYVAVVTGGREENKELLSHKFDLVFFFNEAIAS